MLRAFPRTGSLAVAVSPAFGGKVAGAGGGLFPASSAGPGGACGTSEAFATVRRAVSALLAVRRRLPAFWRR